MGVPKKRRSYTRRHKRRSHHAAELISLSVCSNCREPNFPHRVCPNCNYYKGKLVEPLKE